MTWPAPTGEPLRDESWTPPRASDASEVPAPEVPVPEVPVPEVPAPEGSASTPGRWLRLRGVAALACCVLAIMGINELAERADLDVLWYPGRLGSTVSSPGYDVTVTDVVLTQAVGRGDKVRRTPRTYVVVRWKAAIKRERAQAPTQLRTRDDTIFSARDEFYAGRPNLTAPGFTVTGTSVFDVPTDAVEGASIELGPEKSGLTFFQSGVLIADIVTDQTRRVDQATLEEPTKEATP